MEFIVIAGILLILMVCFAKNGTRPKSIYPALIDDKPPTLLFEKIEEAHARDPLSATNTFVQRSSKGRKENSTIEDSSYCNASSHVSPSLPRSNGQ